MTLARRARPATLLVVLALLLMTCTVTTTGSHAQATHRTSPLIGYWQKTNTCAELLQALRKAGLAKYVPESIGGSGLIYGRMNQPPPDPTHPCAKATAPKKHSHLFSAGGQFASFDEHGMRVDDNTYTLKNSQTFVIGPVIIHFRVRGKVIRFYPVINRRTPCSGHCHLDDLAWAVSAFYPGAPFRRVQSP